jgi:tetratricopeptide (TPR) repeat protein
LYKYTYELSGELVFSDIEESQKLMEQALVLAQKRQSKQEILRAYNGIANCYAATGNSEAAVEFHRKSLSMAFSLKNQKDIAAGYYGLGCDYMRLSDYPKAIECAYKALSAAEKAGYPKIIYSSYGIIADVFMRTGKPDKALATHKKMLPMAKEKGDKTDLAVLYGNIGLTYDYTGDSANAMTYYKMQLNQAREINNKRQESSALGNIGELYMKQGDFKEALEYELKCLEIKKMLGSKLGISGALLNVGSTYFELGNLQLSKKYCLEALELTRKIKAPDYEVAALELLGNINGKEGNYKEALDLYKQQISIRDTIYNREKQEDITRRELTYEFGKKTATDSIKAVEEKKVLAERNNVQELQLSRSRFIIYALTGLSLLVLLIAYLFIRQNKLRAERHSLQLEQKLLRLQMSPHFIFNCLQAIQNFIEDKKAAKYLSSFGALSRSVLENSRMEYIPLEKEIALLRHYLELQKLLHEEQFNYRIDADPDLDVVNIRIPPMLAQPFIENAIEHGMRDIDSGGLIAIRFRADEHFVFLEVVDNGTGMESKADKQYQSMATTITRERLALMNRKKEKKTAFTIEEAFPGLARKGVKVNFSIPI